jgi:TolB-like protein
MLITDLSTVKDLQVVERVRLQALVEELGLGTSGIVEPGTAPRVGKLLGARWLVEGDINGGQQKLGVQSDILEVPVERVLGRPASEGQLEELFRMEKDLLFEILKLVKIDVTPDERTRLMKPCSTRWSALLYLFKGVDASDRGEYQDAAELYEKALREDPQICLAGDALTELNALGLSPAKKKSGELLRSLREGTSLTNQLTPKEELRKEITPKDLQRKEYGTSVPF